MHIVLLTDKIPQAQHTIRAANIVFYELINSFAKLECIKLTVFFATKELWGEEEIKNIELLRTHFPNVEFVEPIYLKTPRRKLFDIILDWERFAYPDVFHRRSIYKLIDRISPDGIVVPWSEWLTAVMAAYPANKLAYYGNPDFKPIFAQNLFSISFSQRIKNYLVGFITKTVHLSISKDYEVWCNVALNDAKLYQKLGHTNAHYLPNTWIERSLGGGPQPAYQVPQLSSDELQVVVNIGSLNATANRLGMRIFIQEFYNHYLELKGEKTIKFLVCGAGRLDGEYANDFVKPDIKVLGFVEDIDSLIRSSSAVLCLNNASPYKVGHTRFLHAWSLKRPIVVHQDAKLSMPEIEDGFNAVVGSNVKQIVIKLLAIVDDKRELSRLGRNGYNTFKKKFSPDDISLKMVSLLKDLKK